MADSFSSPGIDLASPTLAARLREMTAHLAAPAVGRLTEEQRALALGIARRLIGDAAARLDIGADLASLWQDWLHRGLPGAERLAAPCFARAEEHRWREQSELHASLPPLVGENETGANDSGATPAPSTTPTKIERAYLSLQIADRRRFDALGSPAIALADLDPDLLQALLLDIAAWRLLNAGKDAALAAELGAKVRDALTDAAAASGIDHAAAIYHDVLAEAGALSDAAALAIARHDWVALIALAAAAHRRRYAAMALALLTAETAALPLLLAPLRIDPAALAPIEASLAQLPSRAVAGLADAGDEYAAQNSSCADALAPSEGG